MRPALSSSPHVKDGGFQRLATMPSFAGTVHEAGYGEALSSVLH
jgi:hypothetical protein